MRNWVKEASGPNDKTELTFSTQRSSCTRRKVHHPHPSSEDHGWLCGHTLQNTFHTSGAMCMQAHPSHCASPRGGFHLVNDIVELVTVDTSFELLKTGGHIQVAHFGQLLLAVGVVWLDFCLGIQDLGKHDRVAILWQHGWPQHIKHHQCHRDLPETEGLVQPQLLPKCQCSVCQQRNLKCGIECNGSCKQGCTWDPLLGGSSLKKVPCS